MADNIKDLNTSKIPTIGIGSTIDSFKRYSKNQRQPFERRWYDNNFFDDGFHYRYLQRSTNKIVDLSEQQSMYNPMRAIPKASRQIRGITNLLVGLDPVPVILPVKISKANFPEQPGVDPQTGQQMMQPNPMYQEALKMAKDIAKRAGHWVEDEYKNQELLEKLAFMILLTMKHSVSFLQVWPDAVEEKIKTQVYDAFDIYLMGNMTEIEDSPYMGKGVQRLISQIKADERFDPAQVEKISPDNKYASSEIKEAYMTTRYGSGQNPDASATLIQNEFFIKEYLNSENMARISQQDDGDKIMKGRKKGDLAIRQVFSASDIWLRDKYVNLKSYPFVDYRMEPGPIYQVAMIERFIPQNKSLDVTVSRVERYTNTMGIGILAKRRGENYNITNEAGGQIIEYDATPPQPIPPAGLPPFMFNFIQLLTQFIEEQGVSTSTLGKLPPGVRANAAIESLKQSEYANLVIATRRLKQTVRNISKKFLEIADNYFVTPKTVYYMEKGEPSYFDIIGAQALKGRKGLKIETPEDIVPIAADMIVDVEIGNQAAYTVEGRRTAILELVKEISVFVINGLVPPQALKVLLEKIMETYQFGATAEFMDAMDAGMVDQGMTEQDIMKTKIALTEVLKDTGMVGSQADQRLVDSTKVGVAEVMQDTGMGQQQPTTPAKVPSESISFKDLPTSGKVQMAEQAGIQLSPEAIQQQDQQAQQLAQANTNKAKGGI